MKWLHKWISRKFFAFSYPSQLWRTSRININNNINVINIECKKYSQCSRKCIASLMWPLSCDTSVCFRLVGKTNFSSKRLHVKACLVPRGKNTSGRAQFSCATSTSTTMIPCARENIRIALMFCCGRSPLPHKVRWPLLQFCLTNFGAEFFILGKDVLPCRQHMVMLVLHKKISITSQLKYATPSSLCRFITLNTLKSHSTIVSRNDTDWTGSWRRKSLERLAIARHFPGWPLSFACRFWSVRNINSLVMPRSSNEESRVSDTNTMAPSLIFTSRPLFFFESLEIEKHSSGRSGGR